MFWFRQLLVIDHPRNAIAGLLLLALILGSFPVTHANHAPDSSGHVHSHDLLVTALDEAQDSQNQVRHQHIGMNEHNQLFMFVTPPYSCLLAMREGWHPTPIVQQARSLVYELYRPPRAAALA